MTESVEEIEESVQFIYLMGALYFTFVTVMLLSGIALTVI